MAASRSASVIARATQNYLRLQFFLRPSWQATCAHWAQAPGGQRGGCHGNQLALASHPFLKSGRCGYSTAASEQPKSAEDEDGYHNIIKDTETSQGDADKHEFQAETRMLLDIVAKSLYSEKEVFIRELISNASDALEKFHFAILTGTEVNDKDRSLEIHIAADKTNRTFIIQDTGVGMTKEGLQENLGIIARSGSKNFLKSLQQGQANSDSATSIIGQFGVGFYSSFMVANKVEVYSKTSDKDAKGYKWSSEGTGTYDIFEAEGVQQGTKIVLHLKPECAEFADEDIIKGVIKKYSNFVSRPIYLNGKRANTLQALWLMEPKEVTPEMHTEFYRYVGQAYDEPRYILHYRTDGPLSLRCILYVPEGKPGLFNVSPEVNPEGLALYSRKVLIKNKAENLIPKWMRFVKGVVDSEDIPLNLSRELLQDSALIRKLRTVLTNRFIRFLVDQARKDKESYMKFYKDYSLFLKEGIVTSQEQNEKEEIAKLLRFETSLRPEGETVSLPEYCDRMTAGQRDIYYLATPSRQLAETSPYFEAMKKKDVEILFCYEPYDELVLMQLREFLRNNITSVEKEMRRDKEDLSEAPDDASGLAKNDVTSLLDWLKTTLPSVHQVKVTKRLSTHPCVVSVEDMGSARHFIRTQQLFPFDQRIKILEPILEVNTSHPVIKKLNDLRTSHPRLGQLVAEQIYDNAMVLAGLTDDARTVMTRMNELLTLALEKY